MCLQGVIGSHSTCLQFNEFIQEKLPETQWCLVTESAATLRHFLHSEAARNKLKLAQHFHSYFDLCKEVQKAVKTKTEFKNLREIASCILWRKLFMWKVVDITGGRRCFVTQHSEHFYMLYFVWTRPKTSTCGFMWHKPHPPLFQLTKVCKDYMNIATTGYLPQLQTCSTWNL